MQGYHKLLFIRVCQVTAVDIYVMRESYWIWTGKIRRFPPVYVYSERTSNYRARRKLNNRSNPGSGANGLTYPPFGNELEYGFQNTSQPLHHT